MKKLLRGVGSKPAVKIERHIRELYRDDPERADAVVFGRVRDPMHRVAVLVA